MQEVLGIEKEMTVKMSFRLDDVTAVREIIEEGDDEIDTGKCIIHLKCGEYFMITTPYTKMIQLLLLK